MAIINQKNNYKIYYDYENILSLEENMRRFLKKMVRRIEALKNLPNYPSEGSSTEKQYINDLEQWLQNGISSLPNPPEISKKNK